MIQLAFCWVRVMPVLVGHHNHTDPPYCSFHISLNNMVALNSVCAYNAQSFFIFFSIWFAMSFMASILYKCTNDLIFLLHLFTFTLQQLGYVILFKTHFSSTGAACGHMSCFWCVHKAMHVFRESHCAVCRQPYKHFPSICQLMHHLILKLEPADYKRREKEVLGERFKP
jgi:hypothetical protein